MIEEECQELFTVLQDRGLQYIACLLVEGYGNAEIATKLGCAVASVERRFKAIRACWSMAIKNTSHFACNE